MTGNSPEGLGTEKMIDRTIEFAKTHKMSFSSPNPKPPQSTSLHEVAGALKGTSQRKAPSKSQIEDAVMLAAVRRDRRSVADDSAASYPEASASISCGCTHSSSGHLRKS